MSQWGTSDSGILRKNKVEENLDELLVFGYSCKIFRDDEKAIYVDQGKHLIPWMGDETLKIDRYDGRGALSDLRQYEASREGYDVLRWMGLSESEKKLEELCDSERYYALEINEEEEEMYKEEVAKRKKTTAIAFNYENPTGESTEDAPKEGIPTVPEKEEEDEPYKPSPILDVPININIPQTVKVYARIEKTALFVCRQGPQMEILIKAKQADNPQFSFLTVNDPLYKFYRHVYSAFKNGRYQPQCEKKPEEPEPPQHQDDDHDSHYLHPSLLSASAKSDAPPLPKNPPIPSVPYRPSADCAYSQLVNRIQGVGLNNASQPDQSILASQGVAMGQQGVPSAHAGGVAAQQSEAMTQMTMEQQYHHYYYVQQFYEYWRHAVISGEQGAVYASLPTDFSQLDPNMQSYIHQMAWAQFVQHYQKQMQEAQEVQAKANNNSYAQIVSNLNKDGINPYTASVPQLPPLEPKTEQPQPVVTEVTPKEGSIVTIIKPEENNVKKPLLSLAAAYASGSESDSESSGSGSESDSERSEEKETEEEIEVYRVPAGEAQTVIDKMAEYVYKNGEGFEEIIKEKGDPRFDFLKDGHEFYKYYRAKLRELKGEPAVKESKKIAKKTPKPKKIIAPVCFSIKKPKEDAPKEIKNALPMEDSSEEEGYLDNIPKSPQNNAATNGDNSTSQKTPLTPKLGPMIYNIATYVLPRPKTAQLEELSKSEKINDRLSPQKENLSSKRRSESPTSHRKAKRNSSSPRKRSRSPTSSPIRTRRSHTPKKRSASPSKCPVTSKRSKSRSRTPSNKKSPTRSKRSSTRNKSSPIKERTTPARNKKSPIIDMFEVDEDMEGGGDGKGVNGVLESDDPILEMLELEVEKSAEEKAADAKEKARQLERKRKAAMFLKLKSAETSVSATLTVPSKKEKSSSTKSEKSSPVKSEKSTRSSKASPAPSSRRSSRKNSEDSAKIVRAKRSRSRTHEKSKIKEKSISRDESRSKSKESSRSSRKSRSKDRKKDSKKRKKSKEKDRSKSREKEDERKIKKDRKKKSHKRKHSKSKDHESKSKKKSKKHKRSRSPSKSRSISRVQSISSRSRSRSVQSHISIASS